MVQRVVRLGDVGGDCDEETAAAAFGGGLHGLGSRGRDSLGYAEHGRSRQQKKGTKVKILADTTNRE